MCFSFELCIPSYSRSNSVPSLRRFFCMTYCLAITRLWSHPPYIQIFHWRRTQLPDAFHHLVSNNNFSLQNNNNSNNRFTALCPDYLGKPVPEETFTHPPTWSSSNLYQLLPSTMIHSIIPVQITCSAIFSHNLFPCPLWSTSWYIPTGKQWYQLPEFIPSNLDSGLHSCISISIHIKHIT